MQQMQPNVQQVQPQQDQGDPLLGALGTFLPMAFGLPPIPALGQMLGGQSWVTQVGQGISPFMGGFGGGGGFNFMGDPFLNRMQGVPNSFNVMG